MKPTPIGLTSGDEGLHARLAHLEEELRQSKDRLETCVREGARELNEAREKLKEQTRRREETEERLRRAYTVDTAGTLAGGIAHDFNNMLAVVIGNAEMAFENTDDKGTRKSLKRILDASMRARDLVRQIVTFTGSDEEPERPEADAPPVQEGEEVPSRPGREHVLLVDDQAGVVETVTALLEHLGYRVTSAGRSSEALRTFSEAPDSFDLVITDQTMPEMTGIALARELLAIRSNTPIILCTGYSEAVSPEKAQEAGIREFLMKPITKNEMAKTIRRALEQ